jgi:hypothetical protein
MPPFAAPGDGGVFPGAAPTTVPVTVTNGGAAPYTVTALRPDLSALPRACPASAWQIAAPDTLPTVAPSFSVTVVIPVAMPSDAPDSCQGASFHVPVIMTGNLR